MKLLTLKTTFIFLALSCLPAYSQDTIKIDLEMKAALEGIVSNSATGSSIPGISVAIANKDGLLWSGSAGYSNIEDRQSISQAHLFGIGDITGQYVAAVIMQMAEDGLVDLENTPYEILGDTVNDIENSDSATLLELLNHTSGIYSWDNNDDWARRGRGIQFNPAYKWRKDEPLKYIEGNKNLATGKPGEKYSYSKSNYTILGLIIEKLSGGLLEDEVRQRLLEPLNLKDTFYDTFEIVPRGRLAGNYHLGTDHFIKTVGINANFPFESNQLINSSGSTLSAEGIASGIVATPRDLALFSMALKNGDIIKPSSLEKLKTMQFEDNTNIHSEILGFTADQLWIADGELIITSFINLGTVNTGPNATTDYLNSYVKNILAPIANKYASTE